MKIDSLHIYGFGGLEDVKVSFQSGLQLIYGENEAGKSTLKAFILSVLFGFPSRQQKANRYEPKSGMKYGGSVTVSIEPHGLVTIERVKGKAGGEVAVLYEDGTAGTGEDLQTLLKGMTRSKFESIFSFGLDGLQELENVNADMVGEYLFAAGMTGAGSLARVEKQLQKSLEDLYKPNGRKPVLNQKMAEASELEQVVKKKQEMLKDYEETARERSALQEETEKLQIEIADMKKALETHRLVKSVMPYIEEKEKLSAELHGLDAPAAFPENGLEELASLQSQLVPLESSRNGMLAREKQLKKEYDAQIVDENLLALQKQVIELHEYKPVQLKTREEYHAARQAADKSFEDLEKGFGELGLPVSRESVEHLKEVVQSKPVLDELHSRQVKLDEKKALLDRVFHDAKSELEYAEKEAKHLKYEVLPSDKRRKLEEKLENIHNRAEQAARKKSLEGALASLPNVSRQKEQAAKPLLPGIILFSATALASLLLLIEQNWLILGLVLLLAGIGSLQLFSSRKTGGNAKEYSAERAYLIEQLKRLDAELGENDVSEFDRTEIEQKLKRDTEIKSKAERAADKVAAAEKQFDKVVKQFEEWEKESNEFAGEKEQWCTGAGFSAALPLSMLQEKVASAGNLARAYEDSDHHRKQLAHLKKEYTDYGERVAELSSKVMPEEKTRDPIVLIEIVYRRLQEELEKKNAKNQIGIQLFNLQTDMNELDGRIESIRQEIEKLLSFVPASTEEEFIRLGKNRKESERIKRELAGAEVQIARLLAGRAGENEIKEKAKDVTQDTLENMEVMRDTAEGKVKEKEKRLARLDEKMVLMVEDGTAAAAVHKFEYKKSYLDREARKWAVYAIAARLLEKTKEQYRETKLPQVIKEAERIFALLTGGRYVRIHVPGGKDTFIAERVDGLRFLPNELSQATKEQMYLAIRLALAKVYPVSVTFPLLIDDGFVNFDRERTETVMDLLKKEAEHRQVFLFTCHPHLLEHVNQTDVIHLSRAGAEHIPAER
ncbi:ATP-binding protein [Bacillus marinisedimentorum]|uniref:ATP-binding protein n=1 Tax=Bacillus marinisedimentorum TaxID=1821260 RepID=UPI0007E267B9|nr:AAA family ATPase [Bacillus marinisedimentorum]